jgi:hypothetical protein
LIFEKYFLLAYGNSTREIHYDNSIDAYNITEGVNFERGPPLLYSLKHSSLFPLYHTVFVGFLGLLLMEKLILALTRLLFIPLMCIYEVTAMSVLFLCSRWIVMSKTGLLTWKGSESVEEGLILCSTFVHCAKCDSKAI